MELIGQQETARRERDARMAKAIGRPGGRRPRGRGRADQDQRPARRRAAPGRDRDADRGRRGARRPGRSAGRGRGDQQEVTRKQTELAQLEADRTQKELLASTVRPAEAEAEAQIRRAEGDKGAAIAQAQADAERVKLAGARRAGRGHVVEVDGRGDRQADHPRGQRRGRHRPSPRARPRRRRWPCGPRPTASSTRRRSSRPCSRCCRTSSGRPPSRSATSSSLTVLSTEGASDVVRNVDADRHRGRGDASRA